MKIGGYSHFNGVTFFCDLFKIKGIKNTNSIDYNMEWIIPPKWLRKFENKFILNSLLIVYYQWKVLDSRIKNIFYLLIGFYIMDELMDLSFIEEYIKLYDREILIYFITTILLICIVNHKKILKIFRYHGAEHKAINCFIQYGYVDKYLIKQVSRFNKRCGSNIASVFLLLYAPIWFLKIESISIIFIIFLLAIQITKFLTTKNSPLDKYIQLLQWITVLEPNEEEIEVAVGTFNQLQRAYYIYKNEKTKYNIV